MSEFLKSFETLGGLTVDQVLAFAALVVPGFVSLRVYEMLRGGESRTINEVVIDVVVYSFATDLVAAIALALLSAFVPPPAQPPVKAIVSIVIIATIPVALAVTLFHVQHSLMRNRAIPDTRTKPWNRMVEQITKERLDAGVILTLRDGRAIGARLPTPAVLASESDDLLLGEVWTIDKERATFAEPSSGSLGIIVSRADCQTIEFVRWDKQTSDRSERLSVGARK
ncbi:MAG TPA: DUF6338 family protein [Candidatus Elarobacter sp.]|nr:DUF6338 family protein [Candidatus Elarobacter sp.]